MKKIFAFGDSVMRGVIADNDLNRGSGAIKYKVTDYNFVNLCSKEIGKQINNEARFGSTVNDGMKSLKRFLPMISADDVVVLEFGGNDCDFNWREISENPDISHNPKTEMEDFLKVYSQLIDMVKSVKAIPIILSLPEIVASLFFEYISMGLDKSNILKWLNGNVNFISNWHEQYNLAIFKLAAEKNVRIIDISSVFLKQPCLQYFFCIDGMHPNEEGHRLIYNSIIESEKNKLASI